MLPNEHHPTAAGFTFVHTVARTHHSSFTQRKQSPFRKYMDEHVCEMDRSGPNIQKRASQNILTTKGLSCACYSTGPALEVN